MSTTNATTPPSILLPDPATVIGPIFIGNMINWLLLGTLIVQLYIFHTSYKDRIGIRVLVYTTFVLDIIQTIFGTHQTWYYAVANWNNGPALVGPSPWTAATIPIMAGLISGMVQIFYAWRIWMLRKSVVMRVFSTLIVFIALAQALTAIITSIVIEFQPTQENLRHLGPAFSFWLAGSFVADVLITICMVYILLDARGINSWDRTTNTIDKLVAGAVQTGAITVLAAAVDLALFVKLTRVNYHLTPAYVLGKLYTNSLLATLNARKTNKPTSGGLQSLSDSMTMRVQVSRQMNVSRNTEANDPDWVPGTKLDQVNSTA